jgi:hypothetical protein
MANFADDYVDVAERIQQLFIKFPDASIQTDYQGMVEIQGVTFLIMKSTVFRTPNDPTPAVDYAWEMVPGKTSFTRGSEMMNGSTSATGRAIAMLGVATKKSIATRQEVQQAKDRQADGDPWQRPTEEEATPKVGAYGNMHTATDAQHKKIIAMCGGPGNAKEAVSAFKFDKGIPDEQKLTKAEASEIIEALVEAKAKRDRS